MLTDDECDAILAEMAKRGEYGTREFVRWFMEDPEANRLIMDAAPTYTLTDFIKP